MKKTELLQRQSVPVTVALHCMLEFYSRPTEWVDKNVMLNMLLFQISQDARFLFS